MWLAAYSSVHLHVGFMPDLLPQPLSLAASFHLEKLTSGKGFFLLPSLQHKYTHTHTHKENIERKRKGFLNPPSAYLLFFPRQSPNEALYCSHCTRYIEPKLPRLYQAPLDVKPINIPQTDLRNV